MPESRFSTHRRSAGARRLFVVFCCAVLVSAVSVVVYGQAGRRVVTRKSDPPVPKAAEPEATPTPKPKETEKVSLVVTSGAALMSRLSLNADDLLQGAVVQRLHDSASLQIASGGRLSRGEANKRARSETTKTYVVWFELQNDASGLYDPTRRDSADEYHVNYVVLEPGTAKTKASGKVYLRATGTSRIGTIGIGRTLPRCYPQANFSNIEFSLIKAGIETAERIFRDFSLPNPPLCS